MQCNPSFYAGYPGTFQPCNTPFQPQWRSPYPDVIGEGEVASVVLPDGSLQLYFLPTTKWPPSLHNQNIPYHPFYNNLGVWIVRSVSNPVPGPIYCPTQPPCGFPTFPRTCFSCNSNIALTLPDHQLKVKFASCTDTQTNTEDTHCICDETSQKEKKRNKVKCECYTKRDSSDSYMSVEDTRSRRSYRNKRKTSKGRKKSKEREKSNQRKRSKEQKKCKNKKDKSNHQVKCQCEPSTSKDTSSQSRMSILSIDSRQKKGNKESLCTSSQGSTSNMSTDDSRSNGRKKEKSNHMCECYSTSAISSQSCTSVDPKHVSKKPHNSKLTSFFKPEKKKAENSRHTCPCYLTEATNQSSGVRKTSGKGTGFKLGSLFGSSSSVSRKDHGCECYPPAMDNKAVAMSADQASGCIAQDLAPRSQQSCCTPNIPLTRGSFRNCGTPELWYLKEDPFDKSGMPETWFKKHDVMNISGSSDCDSVNLNSYQ